MQYEDKYNGSLENFIQEVHSFFALWAENDEQTPYHVELVNQSNEFAYVHLNGKRDDFPIMASIRAKRISDIETRLNFQCDDRDSAILLEYWQSFRTAIKGGESLAGGNNTRKQYKKPGRHFNKNYNTAWEKIKNGEDKQNVFQWYCEQENIRQDDDYARDSFFAAMNRRRRN